MDSNERLIELEIRYTQQEQLLEELNDAVIGSNRQVARLEDRIKALESAVRHLLQNVESPPSEKPPHY